MKNNYQLKTKLQTLDSSSKKGYMLALGFFDCLHLGHRALMANLCASADFYNLIPAVFTFDDNFFKALGKKEKTVYTLDERIDILENECGVNNVFVGAPSKDFLALSGDEFLSYLETINVRGVMTGVDFRFGKNAEYGIDELAKWGTPRHVICMIQPMLTDFNKKISSRDIRKYLENGEVNTANSLLGGRYYVCAEVVHGKGLGATYGLPTANLDVNENKLLPLDGVYDTRVKVGNSWFKGVTNVGSCPTFDYHKRTVETHILDFDEDIYGEIIRVEFVERLRCVVKFNSLEELKAQIHNDILKVRESND